MSTGLKRALTISAAAIAWSILLQQCVLLVRATWGGIGPALAIVRFFSYFTVLNNLLAALALTFSLFAVHSHSGRLLASARVRADAASHIGVTACICLFILRTLWAPQGWQWIVDVVLHHVVPAIYWFWWLAGSSHQGLQWSDALCWLGFPVVFLAWVFVRGAWLQVCPYPFLEIDRPGAAAVARSVR